MKKPGSGRARIPTLAGALKALRAYYGGQPGPISEDPFQLILWEQVAYLVPDAQRREAFSALRTRIGLRPAAILAAPSAALAAVARLGGSIAAASRAARMRRSAELTVGRWDGDLRRVLDLPVPEARRALALFPMIGRPGADKILAFAGAARLVPLDSNGLRVVERLKLAPGGRNYGRAYEAAQTALTASVPRTRAERVAGYYLLREHGQKLCRRGVPRCRECPLLSSCPTGRALTCST